MSKIHVKIKELFDNGEEMFNPHTGYTETLIAARVVAWMDNSVFIICGDGKARPVSRNKISVHGIASGNRGYVIGLPILKNRIEELQALGFFIPATSRESVPNFNAGDIVTAKGREWKINNIFQNLNHVFFYDASPLNLPAHRKKVKCDIFDKRVILNDFENFLEEATKNDSMEYSGRQA